MEEEQLNSQRAMCITCLCTDRNLHSIKIMSNVYHILNLLVKTKHYEMCNRELLLCWECLALVQRFDRFRQQAQVAQQYLYEYNDGLKLEDPLAVPTTLSTLACTKTNFDVILGHLSINSTITPNLQTPIVKREPMDAFNLSVHSGRIGQHSKQEYERTNIVKDYIHIHVPANPNYSTQANQSKASQAKLNTKASSTNTTLTNAQIENAVIKPLSSMNLQQNSEIKLETVTKPKKRVKFTLGSVTEPKNSDKVKSSINPNCSLSSDGSETDTASSDGYEEINEFEPKRNTESQPVYGYFYPCHECGKLYKSENGLWYHVQSKHKENVQCDYCKKTYVNKSTLIAHIKLLHQGPLPKEECPVCHQMIVTMRLKRHIKYNHTEKKPVKRERHTCVTCNKIFFTKTGYTDHMRYSKAHRKPENYQFPCSKCDRGFLSEIALEDHVNFSHLGQTRHKCNVCEKPYSCKRSLLKHIRNKHGSKPKEKPRDQVCHECGKAFNCKKTLSSHLLTHSDERPYKCDICQDTFKQSGALYTHRKLKHKVPAKKKNIKIIEENT